MSNTRKLSLVLSVAAGIAACSRGNTAQNDDFANDLKLAQASGVDLATPKVDPSLLNSGLEAAPKGAPQVASTLKKNASGNHAVHSASPTRHAAPTADVAAADESTADIITVGDAAAPDIAEPVAVVPTPGTGPNPGGAAPGDYGTGGNGGGIFGPAGGMGGVVMRGGGADGDHCDPPGGRRPGGRIYIPGPSYPPGGTVGGVGAPRPSGGTIGTRRGTTPVSRPGTIGTRTRGR